MIDITQIINSKNKNSTSNASQKVEEICDQAIERSERYFTSGKQEYLNETVNLFTSAALIDSFYSPIYVSLGFICIKIELFSEAKALLTKLLKFDPKNLIAKDMLKVTNNKILEIKAEQSKNDNLSEPEYNSLNDKFAKFFGNKNASANLKVKVSEGVFRKLSGIFSLK
jgi:hypothetical protein